MTQINPNAPVTAAYLNEAVETILNAMDAIVKDLREESKKEHEKTRNELRKEFRTELRYVEAKLSNEIDGLKADQSLHVTKKEFNEFKRQASN
jgi:hypothetical protein